MTVPNFHDGFGEWLCCPECNSRDVDYRSFPDGSTNVDCNDCPAHGVV